MIIRNFVRMLNSVAISNGISVRFKQLEVHIEEDRWLFFILKTNSNIRVTFAKSFDVMGNCFHIYYHNAYLWPEDCKKLDSDTILDIARVIQLTIGKGIEIGAEEL